MFPIIQIGPLSLQTNGLVYILGVWAALTAIERFTKQRNRDVNTISNLVIFSLAAGLIGARLSYAAANFHAFSGNWGSIFSLTPTMLDPLGGLAAGIITALIYGQRKKLALWVTLDMLTLGFAVFMIFAGVADLAVGRAYGIPTTVPWGIELWGAKRHPTQIYASLAALAAAAVFYWQQRHSWQITGAWFLTWVSLTAFLRILLETLRADSVIWGQGLRASQLAGWVILAISLYLLGKRLGKAPTKLPESSTISTSGGVE